MSEAKEEITYDNMKEDLVDAGFHKLDDKLVTKRPPRIDWGRLYKKFTNEEKITYLEKLASSMNNAAYLIQSERSDLNKICELKEGQIMQLKTAMEQNTNMLQSEITKINEERQSFNEAYAKLQGELKELKG